MKTNENSLNYLDFYCLFIDLWVGMCIIKKRFKTHVITIQGNVSIRGVLGKVKDMKMINMVENVRNRFLIFVLVFQVLELE